MKREIVALGQTRRTEGYWVKTHICDCDTDEDDLATWLAGYGTTGMPGDLKAMGDADNDGDVDGADWLELQREYGVGVMPLAAANVVPEPRVIYLVIVGASLITYRRS